jgi:hypothetical protein
MNNDKEVCALEEIHNKLSQRIEGIYATIDCHLDDNDINVDISFLRKLYAEAKGLREADKIVYDKLKELTKEDENV